MIFSSIFNKTEINLLPQQILDCINYSEKNCLSHYDNGEYKVSDEINCEISSYMTDFKEKRFWQAHKENYYLYLTLSGNEYILLDFTENMKKGKYTKNDDFLRVKPISRLACRGNAEILMRKGDILLCTPDDSYMTRVTFNEPEFVKNALFKIKIKNNI